jgi:MFS family permease
MGLVDVVGRRPLLLFGSIACALAMFGLCAGLDMTSVWMTTVCMCLYITSFSVSWAGVFWVVCSEMFSMSSKSSAMSLATAALFLSGALADMAFPVLVDALGGGAFALFGILSLLGGAYVWVELPETKGLSLLEVQAALQIPRNRFARRLRSWGF